MGCVSNHAGLRFAAVRTLFTQLISPISCAGTILRKSTDQKLPDAKIHAGSPSPGGHLMLKGRKWPEAGIPGEGRMAPVYAYP